MRCEEWQKRRVEMWEDRPSPEMERHGAECEKCARQLRDLRLVRAGFGALKSEAVPEPSLGFSERLVRRLVEMGARPTLSEFFELIGRRFVYATLVLTFLALLALALPPAGPVRGLASADLLIPAQEVTQAHLDPLGETPQLDVAQQTAWGPLAVPER